jgi:hypothetical protein
MYRLVVGCIWEGSRVRALGGMARFRVSVAFDADEPEPDEPEPDESPPEQAARGRATATAAAMTATRNRRNDVRDNSNSLV